MGKEACIWAIMMSLILLTLSVTCLATTIQYDELGRLWIITYDDGTTITYEYDTAGNRKTMSVDTPPRYHISAIWEEGGTISPPSADVYCKNQKLPGQ